ncbi:MAG: hypothetical protein D6732_13670 [Methanobacteriota archaeon]|nr:MAG: hypothetical protein D6732_13670 [Euryarchaeota archaeon]
MHGRYLLPDHERIVKKLQNLSKGADIELVSCQNHTERPYHLDIKGERTEELANFLSDAGAVPLDPFMEWLHDCQGVTILEIKNKAPQKTTERKQPETLDLDPFTKAILNSYRRKKPLKETTKTYPDRGPNAHAHALPFLPKILKKFQKLQAFDSHAIQRTLLQIWNGYFPFEPRPRQWPLIEKVLQGFMTPLHDQCDHGEGIILDAPTGMGKTLVSLSALMMRRGLMRKPPQILVFVRTHTQYHPIIRDWIKIEKRRLEAPFNIFARGKGIDGLGRTLLLPLLPKERLCRLTELTAGRPETCKGCPLYDQGKAFKQNYGQPQYLSRLLKKLAKLLFEGKDPMTATEEVLENEPGCPYLLRNAMLHETDIVVLPHAFLNPDLFTLLSNRLRSSVRNLLILVDEAHHLASRYLDEQGTPQDKDISHLHQAASIILQSGSFIFPHTYRALFISHATVFRDQKGSRLARSPQVKWFKVCLRDLNSAEDKRENPMTFQRYAEAILRITHFAKGHTLVATPSYQFLDRLAEALPHTPYVEHPETTTDEFNHLLHEKHRKTALVVAGGKFAEGVEWTSDGRSLVDQVIFAGIPYLPQTDQTTFRKRTERLWEIYTNATCTNGSPPSRKTFQLIKSELNRTIPFLHRIDQTVGRAIRSPQDTAQVWFIDDRPSELLQSFYRPYTLHNLSPANFSHLLPPNPYLDQRFRH